MTLDILTSDALVIPPTRLNVGDCAFSRVSAARVWNGLPAHVTSLPALHVFMRHLTTVVFSRSYPTAASQWTPSCISSP